ncbi:VOC family protein [Chachezhania antarctica]|uniref:VOC family protein n=1 Tax=Chachezhania antarctica TaxID=2340860 RepID=UPI000EAE0650|nr:VOC family protein [Chachezhania antarctica]|tara:strand:- start:2907 stop:3275 length:369 start_codon:yes stop_codon:yes gene_type:complete
MPHTPLKLGRITATVPVSDIERACAVYRDVFGFEKIFENGDPTGFVILKKDDAELHLTLHPGHKGARFNVAHMMVSNAAEAHARCLSHGLRIIKSLQDKEYGLKAFVFADPDGNRIDVGQQI